MIRSDKTEPSQVWTYLNQQDFFMMLLRIDRWTLWPEGRYQSTTFVDYTIYLHAICKSSVDRCPPRHRCRNIHAQQWPQVDAVDAVDAKKIGIKIHLSAGIDENGYPGIPQSKAMSLLGERDQRSLSGRELPWQAVILSNCIKLLYLVAPSKPSVENDASRPGHSHRLRDPLCDPLSQLQWETTLP